MTVTTTTIRTQTYVPTGVQTAFPIDIYTAGVDQLRAVLDDVTVNPALYVFARDDDGTGEVTFTTAPVGVALYFESSPDFTQQTAFGRYGPQYLEQTNTLFDAAAARDLWLKDRVDRSWQVPLDGSANGKFPVVLPGGVSGFSNGNSNDDAGLREDLADPLYGGAGVAYKDFTGPYINNLANKVREDPSVTATGAKGTDDPSDGDQLVKVQDVISQAIDLGLKTVRIPPGGLFRIGADLDLTGASNFTLLGSGPGSGLHLVEADLEQRGSAITGAGTSGDRIKHLRLVNLDIIGDVDHHQVNGEPRNAANGVLHNGCPVYLQFIEDCLFSGINARGFSDGFLLLNSNRSKVVDFWLSTMGQNLVFAASTEDAYGNMASRGHLLKAGTFNLLHLEGGWGGGGNTGRVLYSIFDDVYCDTAREAGINIELAYFSKLSNFTVLNAGQGDNADSKSGIKIFGGLDTEITSGSIHSCGGPAITVGANSSRTSIDKVKTRGNTQSVDVTGSFKFGSTYSANTDDVRLGPSNDFGEGAPRFDAPGTQTSSSPQIAYTSDGDAITLRPSPQSLNVAYMQMLNNMGTRVWLAGMVDRNPGNPDFEITHEGDAAPRLVLTAIGGHIKAVLPGPYADNAAAVLNGVPVNGLYKLTSGGVGIRT
jgi:hypothetical protein